MKIQLDNEMAHKLLKELERNLRKIICFLGYHSKTELIKCVDNKGNYTGKYIKCWHCHKKLKSFK